MGLGVAGIIITSFPWIIPSFPSFRTSKKSQVPGQTSNLLLQLLLHSIQLLQRGLWQGDAPFFRLLSLAKVGKINTKQYGSQTPSISLSMGLDILAEQSSFFDIKNWFYKIPGIDSLNNACFMNFGIGFTRLAMISFCKNPPKLRR